MGRRGKKPAEKGGDASNTQPEGESQPSTSQQQRDPRQQIQQHQQGPPPQQPPMMPGSQHPGAPPGLGPWGQRQGQQQQQSPMMPGFQHPGAPPGLGPWGQRQGQQQQQSPMMPGSQHPGAPPDLGPWGQRQGQQQQQSPMMPGSQHPGAPPGLGPWGQRQGQQQQQSPLIPGSQREQTPRDFGGPPPQTSVSPPAADDPSDSWRKRQERPSKQPERKNDGGDAPRQGARDKRQEEKQQQQRQQKQKVQSSQGPKGKGKWREPKGEEQTPRDFGGPPPQTSVSPPAADDPSDSWKKRQELPSKQPERKNDGGDAPRQGAWEKRQERPSKQPGRQHDGGGGGDAPRQGAWEKRQERPSKQPGRQHDGGGGGDAPRQGAWEKRQEQPSKQPEHQHGGGDAPRQKAWGKERQQQQQRAVDQPPPSIRPASEPEGPGQRTTSTELVEFAPRIVAPKKSGRPIKVATNFYPMTISNFNMVVYHYDVTMEPDKPKYMLRPVWRKFSSQYFPERITVFDGVKNAYCKNELIPDVSFSGSVTVLNPESERNKDFNVTIKLAQKIDFSVLKDYRKKMLEDKRRKVLPEAEIMVLDIILKNFAADNFVQSSRTFFRKADSRVALSPLSKRLNMRYGFFQSAFLGYKPYLIFDIAHKPFYKACSCLELVEEFRNRNGTYNIDDLNHFVRNMKVQYQLPNNPESRRIYRINKVVENAATQTFQKEDGSRVSVADYFAREKNIRLRRPDLPLLWVGPTQKSIYIPMEFCEIVEDQVYKGAMNPFETREMVKNATTNARDRKRYVDQEIAGVQFDRNQFLKEFGISVSGQMEIVDARVLDAPTLTTSRPIYVREGVWNANDFLKPMNLKRWCILNLDRYVSRENLRKLQNLIISRGRALKMNTENPAKDPIEGETSQAFLKKTFSQLRDMDIVFVVISEAKGVYSRVKTICETQEGVLTQCIKSRTVSQDERKISTTIDNILLKVNAKLGGKNHSLDARSMPDCLKGYTMIVGADVTHSGPGSSIPSVAAVAVCCDPMVFQYGTTIRVQTKEIIKNLDDIMETHLKYFYKTRQANPDKIFFFRDGVSEGQLDIVFNEELKALKKVGRKYGDPKVTFVVVQKRHHTRFYPTSKDDETGKNMNVPVGTCVDTDVVHPRDLDFYLVSHASILGTARPTRYRLLYDENRLTDDELEKLSYYLCHMFSRCKRSVSYPSPTYHAHLAAFRARAYLEELRATIKDDLNSIQRKMTDRISDRNPMFFV